MSAAPQSLVSTAARSRRYHGFGATGVSGRELEVAAWSGSLQRPAGCSDAGIMDGRDPSRPRELGAGGALRRLQQRIESELVRLRGRVRRARGHCPACDGVETASCDACRGYAGPHPVDVDTQLRWWHRFEASLRLGSASRAASDPSRVGWGLVRS